MPAKKVIRFGVIGGGLMGREFASAAARWCHLPDLDFEMQLTGVCDLKPTTLEWFQSNIPTVRFATTDYRQLLEQAEIDAIYCAIPHNQHQQVYSDVLRANKHLLGEKPFGIDLAANQAILEVIHDHPDLLVRCSSQFPFFPGAYRILQWIREGRFGQIIEVEAGFWHSGDLDPGKPINWKRVIAANGEYGCMGDLGMHVLHIPLRSGWNPVNVKALLSKIVTERPDKDGKLAPCETWDNAILACEGSADGKPFPMLLSFKRIAPGHANTWFIKITGTALTAEFSTRDPKRLTWLPYTPGGAQEWRTIDMPYETAYPVITGKIFEFGFSDALLQMWAAYCDELVHGPHMRQPFYCATPEETAASHRLFTDALDSQRDRPPHKMANTL